MTKKNVAFKSIAACLTLEETLLIKDAMQRTKKLSEVLTLTGLQHKLPAVSGYMRATQDQVCNAVKHTCYTTIDSFLHAQGNHSEELSNEMRRILGMSFATEEIHSLNMLLSAYEISQQTLQSFKLYSKNKFVRQAAPDRFITVGL